MNHRAHHDHRLLSLLGGVLLGLAACGEEPEPGSAQQEAALTSIFDTCIGRSPDATLSRETEGAVSSPTTYGTTGCKKSWLVDLPAPAAGDDFHTVSVHWTDPWPRSQIQCVGGKLKVEVMSRGEGELVYRGEGSVEAPLVWDATKSECQYRSASVGHYPPWGSRDYDVWALSVSSSRDTLFIRPYPSRRLRVVASALTPAGSTQSITVNARPSSL